MWYIFGICSFQWQIHVFSWLSTNGLEQSLHKLALCRQTVLICSTCCIASCPAHNMKLWQQSHFYEPYFRIRTNATKPTVGVFVAALTIIITIPLVLIHTFTQANRCNRVWTSGFMVREQQFFMWGLDKQYLEPIDRYAVYYPIFWNTSLAGTGQWTRHTWSTK